MDQDFYKKIREFVAKKLDCLVGVEPRGFGLVGIPAMEFFQIVMEERTFYVVSNRVFYELVDKTLLEATEKFPDSFGKNDPEKVLRALYDAHPFDSYENFKALLGGDNFALIIEFNEDELVDKVLRIELFRLIHDESPEFTGGLLHAYKHFSCNGVPLSTGPGEHSIVHPQYIFNYFIKAFFLNNFTPGKKKDYFDSIIPIDDEKGMKLGLYLQPKCQVYFINTMHIINL